MKVLIVGRQAVVMEKILPLLKNAGFEAIGVLTDDEAVQNLRSGSFDVIAVGGGVEPESREKIRTEARETTTEILEIFGPDTLLPRLFQLRESKKAV
ncbi:MAG: iron-containing alcohol dehydrogenase [Pyrinomonadaceae bacterium]|nr:iron-containing alcohol dehydrogenase [Pyrinomonadaceae bacterium]